MSIILFKSFLTTLLIYFSGISFSNILLNKKINKNIFEEIFVGFAALGFVALVINFFYPLSSNINSIFFLIIFLYSIFIIKKLKKKQIQKDLILLILISILASILIFKSNIFRPDAGLYHLPFTKILNEEKIVLGLSNLHFRFGHVSILQYINAINFNWFQGSSGILFPVSILVSTFIIFLGKQIKEIIHNTEFSYQFFIILILFFSVTYLERYSDFGNDAIGYIYSILCIIYFFKLKKIDFGNIFYFELLILFSVFSFLNKSFLILFLLIPLYFVKSKNLFFLLKNKIILFSFIFLIFWFLKNLLISGCLIYPSTFTCFDLTWTNIEKTIFYNIAGEAASKGYLDLIKYNELSENITMSDFNKNFQWLHIWFEYHFFKIFEKLMYFMIFILLIFAYKVFQIKKIIKNQKKEFYYLLIFSLVGLILWFLKFPLYRYGVSYLVIFIICISVILFNNLNFSVLKKREIIYITVFCYFIFIGVNLNRIMNKFYLHDDLPNIYFMGKNISYQKKIINNQYYYYADSECLYNKNLCTHLDVSLKFKTNFGYKIFY